MATEEVNFIISALPGTMSAFASLNAGLVSINNAVGDITRQIDNNFGIVNSAMITMGVVATQVAFDAANAFGQFEQSMKIVQMVSGQTKAEIDQLGQAANQFSVQYRVDIDQITEGLQTLGRAGLNSATEQSEVLQNGLNTAKLEGRELNSVLEELIQNTALLGGNLKSDQFGEQTQYVNDLLVATSMTAPITTHDVSETLKYSGGIAAAAGANIESDEGKEILEDYMGAIAAFAQKGVTGSIAGTALRAFFNKPATQDSSVTEALETIGLSPEALWKDGGETMKPVSQQIGIIQSQMEKLNISTMDQLQIWSKIVGGKMGQQMMKLDSSDIKTLTKDIQSAENAEALATKSMQTYQANIKEMGERGAKAFREFGESIVYFVNPFLEFANKVMGFLDNDFMRWPLAISFFVFLSKVASKVKDVFGRLKDEFQSLKAMFDQGLSPTVRDLRPQSSKGDKYGYQNYTLEGAETLTEYSKALAHQRSAAKLQELKEMGLSDSAIGAYAVVQSWTGKNKHLSELAGRRIEDKEMMEFLLTEGHATPKMIDILAMEGKKDYKMGLLGDEPQELFKKYYNDGELLEKRKKEFESKMDESLKDMKWSTDENTDAVNKNTEAQKNQTNSEDANKSATNSIDAQKAYEKTFSGKGKSSDVNWYDSYVKQHVDYNNQTESQPRMEDLLTDKNRILWEDYLAKKDDNKGREPYSMKIDRGNKIPYIPSWITWIQKHPDRDVDFSRLQLPKFDDIINDYLKENPMHSDAEKDLLKKYSNKKSEIVSAFNSYKEEARNLLSLPYITVADLGARYGNKEKGFAGVTVKEMKNALLSHGFTEDDFKREDGHAKNKAELAKMYHPIFTQEMLPYYTADSFRNTEFGGFLSHKEQKEAAAVLGVPQTGPGTSKENFPIMLEQRVSELINQQKAAEEAQLKLEQEQATRLEEIQNELNTIAQNITAQEELEQEKLQKEKERHEESLKTDIEGNAEKDPRLIGWEEEKKELEKKKDVYDKPIGPEPNNTPWYYKDKDVTDAINNATDKAFSNAQEKSARKFENIYGKENAGANPVLTQLSALKNVTSDPVENFFKKPKAKVGEKMQEYVGGFFGGLKTRLGADRPDRMLGYAKANTSFKKVANVALNAADMMGGPLMVAMMALTVVINYVQGLYDEHCQKLKEAGDKLSDAYSSLETAEDKLKTSFQEANPGATSDEINQMVYDTYAQITDDMQNNIQQYIEKVAPKAATLPEYEDDTEADDGSMKEKEEEKTSAEQQAEAIDENTSALYAATAELSLAMDQYVREGMDSIWGIDEFGTTISDSYGKLLDFVSTGGEGSKFTDGNSFLLTASQQDENYAGYTEMAGLMLEDFKDANGDWIAGLRRMMGQSINDFAQIIPEDSKSLLNDLAKFSSGLGTADNLRLQQSMKRDKKTWQSLAKEIAKEEHKSKKNVTKDTENKKIQGLISKLQATMGAGFNKTQILQGAYLQQMQDMYSIAQTVMTPLIAQNAQSSAQNLLATQGVRQTTDGTGASTYNTASITSIIAGYVAMIAQQSAKDATYDYAINMNPKTDEEKWFHDKAMEAQNADAFYKELKKADEGGNFGWFNEGVLGKIGQALGLGTSHYGMDQYLKIYGSTAYQTAYGMSPDAANKRAEEYVKQARAAGNVTSTDILNTLAQNYQSGQFKDALMGAYLASDLGEDTGSGSGSGSGSGDSDKDSGTKTKKERVDLVLCNKKEIPKLNVNLFKKAPSFTVLNKNFKLRDIKVNTEDKPKAILSSIKNAIIDVQKRSDPKIIQDESAEYDPVSATDGSSVPTGSTNTSTDA